MRILFGAVAMLAAAGSPENELHLHNIDTRIPHTQHNVDKYEIREDRERAVKGLNGCFQL